MEGRRHICLSSVSLRLADFPLPRDLTQTFPGVLDCTLFELHVSAPKELSRQT